MFILVKIIIFYRKGNAFISLSLKESSIPYILRGIEEQLPDQAFRGSEWRRNALFEDLIGG